MLAKQHRLSTLAAKSSTASWRCRAPPNNSFLTTATTVFSWRSQPPARRCHHLHLRVIRSSARNWGTVCFPDAEFSLHKMLRSRCFATIVHNALFREAAHCFTKCDPISNRHLWNECAQLTLIPARDFNVTDANRAMRARFNDAAIHRFFIGVYPATPASRTECTFMIALVARCPGKSAKLFRPHRDSTLCVCAAAVIC